MARKTKADLETQLEEMESSLDYLTDMVSMYENMLCVRFCGFLRRVFNLKRK